VRSEAVLRLLAYLGMPWSLGRIGGLLPVGMRDRAYDWVARRRLHLVRGAPACSRRPPNTAAFSSKCGPSGLPP
jgi:predicted DCC family thiol-disulfide oxidoreductase YuxK